MSKVKPVFNEPNEEIEKLKDRIETLEKEAHHHGALIIRLIKRIESLEDSVYDV